MGNSKTNTGQVGKTTADKRNAETKTAYQRPFGLANPHPLSQMKTELVWEGKYDEFGNRREVDIAGAVMPLQRIETVDDPFSRAQAEDDQPTLFRLEQVRKKLGDFRNMLVWGENKLVMASLLKEFKGKIDLIYVDPPFDVGADFTMPVPFGSEGESIEKEQSTLEMVAYSDMWGRGTDSYLAMMYERIVLMRELLSPTGNFYIHSDRRVVHFLRSICDEVFDRENLRNEIIWCYRGGGTPNKAFAEKHDTILRYSKSGAFYFDIDPVRIPYSEASSERLEHKTNVFRGEKVYSNYQQNEAGKHPEDWWTIQPIMPSEKMERADYPTQKPVELIQRIVDSSCPPDGIVLDAFCGSGTTAVVAEGLRVKRDPNKKPGSDKYLDAGLTRKWIAIDLGRFSIHVARKRLIDLQRWLHVGEKSYRAFDVYNLGRYERQWWQNERLKGADDEHRSLVMSFYHADPLPNSPSPLLHGRKGPAFIHVSSIDTVFSRADLKAVASVAKAAGARELKCLAWDFEMDLRLNANSLEAELDMKIALLRIPREIMEKNRTEVPFFEIGSLDAEPVIRRTGGKATVDIKLKGFLPSLAEVPAVELDSLKERAVKHGFDFIDFWAVDFNYKDGQPFHHHWQDYRSRRDRSLKTVTDIGYEYARSGIYTACVKVIDTFGCDTSLLVKVKV